MTVQECTLFTDKCRTILLRADVLLYLDRLGCNGPLQRQDDRERRSLTHGAGNVDAALVIFDDAASQGES